MLSVNTPASRISILRRAFEQAAPALVTALALGALLVWLRSPWPLDETRLLAIAWEMWRSDIVLLPVLNEAAYPWQMPVLPWLIQIGWWVFGVNDWWPQFLAVLFGAGSLMVTSRLAFYLWVDQLDMPRYAPAVLLSTWFFVFFLSYSLGVMALTFFTLLALLGMLRSWRYTTRGGWMIYGASLGCAILTSGMIALFYILPIALLAPFWAGREHALQWRHWYLDMATGIGVAVSLVALWGMVVSVEYGTEYAIAYLVGILPGSIDLFPARQPIYWYFVLLPLLALPWSAWPLVYHRLWQVRGRIPSTGAAFVALWVISAVFLLSLIPPRQPQVLLPLLPALALVVSFLILNDELVDHGEDRFIMSPVFPVIVFGLALAALPYLPDRSLVPDRLTRLPQYAGLLLAGAGLGMWTVPRLGIPGRISIMVLGIVIALLPQLPPNDYVPAVMYTWSPLVGVGIATAGVLIGFLPRLEYRTRLLRILVINLVIGAVLVVVANGEYSPRRSLYDAAQLLRAAETAQRPIAHVGNYDGQYHFAGRLETLFHVVTPEAVPAWIGEHPDGLVVSDPDRWRPADAGRAVPAGAWSYRETTVQIWDVRTLPRR